VDKVEKVRKQALRGLGNLTNVWSEVSESLVPGCFLHLSA